VDITILSRGARVYLLVYVEGGKLIFQVFASVVEFERDLIWERTMAGLEAARARGRNEDRKQVMDAKKMALASKLLILQ
jgi:DNA invertase Pin-like site-specific DNA recombinase